LSQPPPPSPPETLAAIWAARGIDASAVAPDSTGTIGRSAIRVAETLAARPDSLVRSDRATLALGDPDATQPGTSHPRTEALELGPIIGRGAMGVVRLATQTALKRTVAVKQVVDPTDEVVAALLREAWIAGNLEHPNILPIHALTESSRGNPLLVMKRIEGVPWSRVLTHPDQVPGGERIDDPLEWHLRVLTRVCRAVHFAHVRGVVHLDIKPDNVMLGRFGEVYLVDWGLAASLEADVPAWMPRATDIKVVVGTPAYMAPEQAIASGDRIDGRTDVYQLGAVLHEIITGERLHTGSVLEAVGAAFRSTPPELPGVPQELAALCRRAVARDRAERFATADALRLAIEAFLQHRHATALADEALDRLQALEIAPESEQQQLIDECRFGLRLALRAWPDQPRAQAGLQRLLHWVAERHLARNELDAARTTAAELQASDLLQRVEARAAELAAEGARLTALRQDRDLNLNRRQRLRWVGLVGVLWLVWNSACGMVHRSGWVELGYLHLFGLSAITLAAFAGGAWSVRRTLRRISVDRQIVDTLGAGLATVPLVWVGGALLDLPPLHAVALSMPLYVLFMAALALGVDRRMRKVPLALAHLAVLAAMVPEFAFEITGLAGFLSAIPAAIVWSRADVPRVG
jgi:hypothetical protein